MRAVIQKVKYAKLIIDSEIYSQIEEGLMVLLGIEDADTKEDIEWLADKIRKLRIFEKLFFQKKKPPTQRIMKEILQIGEFYFVRGIN